MDNTLDDLEDNFWKKPTSIRNYYNMKNLGYVNMTLVATTVTSNILVMLVITRQNMISPINVILAHYIGANAVSVFGYMLRTYHEFFRVQLCSIPEHNTYTWEMISYHSYLIGFIFRHVAVWMAMMLAVWRYIAISHPFKERRYCNMNTTNKFISAGYMFNLIVAIPPYMGIFPGPAVKLLDQNGCLTTNYTIGKNVTIYEFQIPWEQSRLHFTGGVVMYAIFLKLIPSLVMAIIIIKLINNLRVAKKRREEMVLTSNLKDTYNSRTEQQMRKRTERTTIILLMILALFVVGEVPHGIYAFLTGWYGPKFFWKYYYYAMEFFNTFIEVAESFNFLVFYSMSRQFRSSFKSLLISSSNNTKIRTPQTSNSFLPWVGKAQDDSTRASSIATISSNCT